MKKSYEKPVLTVEEFDLEDVITESGAAGGVGGKNKNFETEEFPFNF